LIARLLAVAAHCARGLIDVALESAQLIGQRLFALSQLPLLLFTWSSALSAAGKLIEVPRYFILPLERFLGLSAELLDILLTRGPL
jgi:hypothetical protein